MEVNLVSLSDTMDSGIPWSLTTSLNINHVTPLAVIVIGCCTYNICLAVFFYVVWHRQPPELSSDILCCFKLSKMASYTMCMIVRYWSLMNLWQVCSTPPSSAIPFPSSSPSYFHHISNTPPFVPVPLVSSFIPTFPVSLLSVSMSPWSSCLSHIVFLPCSCFPCFMLVPLFLVPDQVKPTLQGRVS